MRPLVPLPIPLNGLLKHPRTRLIQFSQITQHDMLTIITHEIGATGLSAPFKKYLISKSFDSPLFAAEMARELKAGGNSFNQSPFCRIIHPPYSHPPIQPPPTF